MTIANRFWLWSQTLMIVVVVAASVVGLMLPSQGDEPWGSTLAVSINSFFYLPGIAISLAINQSILLFRKPQVVTIAERVLLSIEFLIIIGLIAVSGFDGWALAAIALALSLVPAGVTVLVMVIVGNALATQRRIVLHQQFAAPPMAP
ncbi:MAG: hypothetical protein ACOH1T_01510 [Microbacteriaceae bacterium]